MNVPIIGSRCKCYVTTNEHNIANLSSMRDIYSCIMTSYRSQYCDEKACSDAFQFLCEAHVQNANILARIHF